MSRLWLVAPRRSGFFGRHIALRPPSSRCASAIQIVRPLEINRMASSQRVAFSGAKHSNYFWKIGRNKIKGLLTTTGGCRISGYIRRDTCRAKAKMAYSDEKIILVLRCCLLVLVVAGCRRTDTVNCWVTAIIDEFRQMPEESNSKRCVLSHARGLANMSVFKAGFISQRQRWAGVVVARTPHIIWPIIYRHWWCRLGSAGAQVTDFVIVLNNNSAAVQSIFPRRKRRHPACRGQRLPVRPRALSRQQLPFTLSQQEHRLLPVCRWKAQWSERNGNPISVTMANLLGRFDSKWDHSRHQGLHHYFTHFIAGRRGIETLSYERHDWSNLARSRLRESATRMMW